MIKSPEEIVQKYGYSEPQGKGYLVKSLAITLLLTAWFKLMFWTTAVVILLHFAIKYW